MREIIVIVDLEELRHKPEECNFYKERKQRMDQETMYCHWESEPLSTLYQPRPSRGLSAAAIYSTALGKGRGDQLEDEILIRIINILRDQTIDFHVVNLHMIKNKAAAFVPCLLP